MDNSRVNYAGPSSEMVDLGFITVWFSYQTVVAFKLKGYPVIVCKNEWGSTTGKHLNAIHHDPKDRIDGRLFRILWDEFCQTGTIQNHPAYS